MHKSPQTLADLDFEEDVVYLKKNESIISFAAKFFKRIFDFDGAVWTRIVFVEDGKTVYESHMDSQYSDYLYIVQ